jgi:hypothetical protein
VHYEVDIDPEKTQSFGKNQLLKKKKKEEAYFEGGIPTD